jgi:hypothetical protein
LVVGEYDEALPRGVVAPGAGVVGVAEPVVRGVKKPPEHHWVRHAGEVPLRVPVRGGRWQFAGVAVGRLIVGGGAGVPNRWSMADRTGPARRCVGVGGGDVRRCGAAQADGVPQSRNRALPRRSGCRLTSGRIVLQGDARSASALRPRLSRALVRASMVSRCWRTHNIHLGRRRGVSSGCDGDRVRPGRLPRTEFVDGENPST